MVTHSVFVTHPIGALSLNDGAKIRLFSGTTKFQGVIRADFSSFQFETALIILTRKIKKREISSCWQKNIEVQSKLLLNKALSHYESSFRIL